MATKLGYACISLPMREIHDVYTGRTMILKTLHERGVDAAKQMCLENIEDLIKIIQYNEDCGIRFFRITSNLAPQQLNAAGIPYDLEFAKGHLKRAGDLAKKYGHRITCHPGQFAQLGSPRQEVVDRTFDDLINHAKIFQYMGLTPEMGSVMIIHGGGVFGDKPAALQRFEENFMKLPKFTRDYIVLENDEWSYSVLDLLPVCEKLQIPLCVDFFHHQIGHSDKFNLFSGNTIDRCMLIWKKRGIKPKCHWSNQAPGERKGTHADCVTDIPTDMWKVCTKYSVDIMLETKLKDLCLMRMLEKYYDKTITRERVDWTLKEKIISVSKVRE
jgi:UV DNA damage endonuclease